MRSDPLTAGDDCDAILSRLREHVRQFWQAMDLGDYRESRRKIRDTLDELHQGCPGEWTQPNFDGLVEDVKERYEMGSHLKRMRADVEKADLDFQELTE